MVNPLTGGEVRIDAQVVNHWITAAMGVIIIILGWSFQQQANQIARLQDAHVQTIQTLGGIVAEMKAHEISDTRVENTVDVIGKKQSEVLARLSAIETYDGQTLQAFTRLEIGDDKLGKRIDDLSTGMSQRIDGIDRQMSEMQRQIAAIEGKLGESVPNKR